MLKAIKETVEHERGDNALYDAVDFIFLTVIAIIDGALFCAGSNNCMGGWSIEVVGGMVVNTGQQYAWSFIQDIPE